MKKFSSMQSFTLMFLFLSLSIAPLWSKTPTSFNSFRPQTVWPADDGVHIDCHAGMILYHAESKTYYWFGERRGDVFYTYPKGVACYTSTDLYNWENKGMVLPNGDITIMERPKVIYSPLINKYVMWFHCDDAKFLRAELGVATSDSIQGPYGVIKTFRPNKNESRDISMFIDDDKKAYIIYASGHINKTVRIVELTADYLDVTTNDVDMHGHCEGPGMLKHNGTYYLILSLCTGSAPNQPSYYTASNVMGPYTKIGTPCVDDFKNNTFNSQPCFIFMVPGYKNAYMYMGDSWNGHSTAISQYTFLPITITDDGKMEIRWLDEWDLSVFTPRIPSRRSTDRKFDSTGSPVGWAGNLPVQFV